MYISSTWTSVYQLCSKIPQLLIYKKIFNIATRSHLADEANLANTHTVSNQHSIKQNKTKHQQTQYLLIPTTPEKPSQAQSDLCCQCLELQMFVAFEFHFSNSHSPICTLLLPGDDWQLIQRNEFQLSGFPNTQKFKYGRIQTKNKFSVFKYLIKYYTGHHMYEIWYSSLDRNS